MHASRPTGQDPPTSLLCQCPGMTGTGHRQAGTRRKATQRNASRCAAWPLRASVRRPAPPHTRPARPPPQRTGREGAHGPHVKRGSSASPVPSGRLEPAAPPTPLLSQPRFFLPPQPRRRPAGPRSRPVLTCEARRRDETRRAAAPSAPPGSGCGHRK